MLVKFTNCRLASDGNLIEKDLWIDSARGIIVDPQTCFYDKLCMPDRIVNLDGKIIAPGFIDIQINGAMGVDFSAATDDYAQGVKLVNKILVQHGVTAYCPTITSQSGDVYRKVSLIPLLTMITDFLGSSSSPTSVYSKSTGRFRGPRRPCRRSLLVARKAWNPLPLGIPHHLQWFQ